MTNKVNQRQQQTGL